jgi:hypothetical protein
LCRYIVVLVGVFVYRRVQRERGFKWVMFDDNAANGNGAGNGGQVEMNAAGRGEGSNNKV